MTDSQTIRLIFSRAIRGKTDDAAVRVRPEQLVAAIGQEAANLLAGDTIDVPAIEKQIAATRKQKLDELKAEKRQLLKLMASGHQDSRRELPKVNQLIAKVIKGQLNVQPLVIINVGELRSALAETVVTEDVPASDETPDSVPHRETLPGPRPETEVPF